MAERPVDVAVRYVPEDVTVDVPEGMVLVGWWHAKAGLLTRRYPLGLREPGGDRYDLCPIQPVFARKEGGR